MATTLLTDLIASSYPTFTGGTCTLPIVITDVTSAINTSTGALRVAGGVSTQENLWVGGTLNVGGTSTFNNVNLNGGNILSNQPNVNILNTTVGTINFGGSAGNIVIGSATNGAVVAVRGTTAAISTTTGALTVAGGVGVAGNLYAGNIYSNGSLLTPVPASQGTPTGLAIAIASGWCMN